MLAIEISKRSGDFTVWDDERIKNAFNFGNGTIKHFEAYMSNNKRYFNKSDEAIQTAIDGIKELNKTVTRSGKLSGKYINFTLSNGKISSLALNDAGSHDYFIHKAESGIYYIQKTTQENDYGCEIRKDVCYCVYALA